MSTPLETVESYLRDTQEERQQELMEFLRIPTIGVLSEHEPDVRAGARWLVDRMTAIGLEHAQILETGGKPIVYADWLHADGAPTVIVYCHYDVQPVDPLDLWVRPPFEPRIEGGRIYGRGTADDKGQLHLHLWAARAWLQTQGRLPLNIRYVFEGEEEAGSPNFESWLLANRDWIKGDVVVVSDTSFHEGNHPALTISLRGNAYLEITVRGSRQDLHSGSFGGMVQNPALVLARILASLRDEDGEITVPGFYDECVEPDPTVRAAIQAIPFDEDAFTDEIEVSELFGESGYSPLERKGLRPTLDICGMWSGFIGEGSKTIIPASAHAKVSCRLSAGMDPDKTFERVRDAILAMPAPGVDISITKLDQMWPVEVSPEHPAARAASDSLADVFGQQPYLLYEGGSIGAAASFKKILGTPIVLLGFANPDDQAHSPNESLVLANYEAGARTVARYWSALATQDPPA